MFYCRRKWKGLLPRINMMLSPIHDEGIASQSHANRNDREQLQYLCHWRFLSTWMPRTSKTTATKRTRQSVNQLASLFSNFTYRGAKTSTKVPASLSAREERAGDWICLECEETSEPDTT